MGQKPYISSSGSQNSFSNGRFVCGWGVARVPCLLSCKRAGPGSGAIRHPRGVIITNETSIWLFAKSRDLWGKPMFLLGCGAWAKATSLKCRQSWILSPRTWVEPDHSCCSKGKGIRRQRVGTGGAKGGTEVVNWTSMCLQVLLPLPQRGQHQPGAPKLWYGLPLSAGVTSPGYTATCNISSTPAKTGKSL